MIFARSGVTAKEKSLYTDSFFTEGMDSELRTSASDSACRKSCKFESLNENMFRKL